MKPVKTPRNRRKLLIGASYGGGAFLALLMLLSFFAFRYIDSDATQNRIRGLVAEKIGSSVTFQRAGLSLFPRPHLVFHQVTLTFPETTSGAARVVGIYPEILPLFYGEFRIARFRAVSPDFVVTLSDSPELEPDEDNDLSYVQVKKDISSILAGIRSFAPGLVVDVKNGRVLVRKKTRMLFGAQNIRGRIKLTPEGFNTRVTANTDHFGPLQLQGDFSVVRGRMTARAVQALFLDSTVTAALNLLSSRRGLRMVELSLDGTLGRKTVQWAAKMFQLPPEQTVRAPLVLTNTRCIWKAGDTLSLAGSAAITNGPSISFEAQRTPREFRISRLTIQDDESAAAITFSHAQSVLDFTFQGRLNEKTLDRMFEGAANRRGWVRGELRAHVTLGNPAQSTAQGAIEGANFYFPVGMNIPLKIESLALSAQKKTIAIHTGVFTWGEDRFDLQGSVSVAADGLHVDIDLLADALSLEKIIQTFSSDDRPKDQAPDEEGPKYPPMQGTIRIKAPSLSYGRYHATPVRAVVTFDEQGYQIGIIEATVCGIAIPGRVVRTKEEFSIDFRPVSLQQDLEPAIACVTGTDKTRISGTFDLSGEIQSRGQGNSLLRALEGNISIVARDGKIHRYPLLSRILSAVSLTDLVQGNFSELGRKSIAYSSFTIKGDIKDGVLLFQEAAILSPAVKLTGRGEIDIADYTMDITVLVAPFTTIDAIVGNIPLVGTVLDKTLITIPVKVTGALDDPTVTPLSPTAFGEGAVGIIKRTLQLPYKLIQPFMQEEKK